MHAVLEGDLPTLSDLAERAGLPLSTTHRLVGNLCAQGLLRKTPWLTYLPGQRLLELVRTGVRIRSDSYKLAYDKEDGMPSADSALLQLAEADRERDRAAEKLQRAVVRAVEQGHSQSEVAEVLGVTQPAVSQMLRAARARSRLFRGPVGRRLMAHRRDVRDVARAAGATNLRVFGSVALGEDDEGSDIDLLVRMPSAGLFEITGLGLDISDLLGVPVDVVPEHLVKADMLPQLVARSVPL